MGRRKLLIAARAAMGVLALVVIGIPPIPSPPPPSDWRN